MIYFKRYGFIAQIPPEWNGLVAHDLFLQTTYLKALEDASPTTISLYYIGVFNDDILVGIAIIQRVKLYAKDMFRRESSSRLISILKDGLTRILKGNILVVGNLTHTGQHGLYFNPDLISQDVFLETLFEAIDDLKIHIRKNNHKTIRAILFKDYFKHDSFHDSDKLLDKHGLYKINVQPNMVLEMPPHWHSMADYFNDLKKKYKTRYKRAKKKFGNITSKELTEEEVLNNSEHLHQLYKNVSNNASFNTFVLPEHHFYTFKHTLKDKFRIYGYYLNDELIGFYSLILNDQSLETYFLGYEEANQYDNQLYLNMLYEMIVFGIDHRFKSIVYARTAMEIKSSVGAQPKSMSMYLRHTNPLLNALLKPIFKIINPEQNWEERHPFKNFNES
ncbi:GNAT family N-acetyltransferase [Gelidibacter pelagius]|uniref:GNAT family N-acetyltransferase n=1 Tax=Gelidibacter pelagius TaxID=2819985 RepID=A0ABS3SN75_9FLAO|nr:GNAT family N-acetyltransferase [Gelidibacter pelagius]MBO3096771.1 GNAT family N-acetyltransferase [Gelidibacter pelagius]